MKIYPKIDKEQFDYLINLLLKKYKISLRRLTQLALEILEILACCPEFLDIDPLLEVLEEQSGLPYQQNLICMLEEREIRALIITRSIKGSKTPKVFSFPLESIANQIPTEDIENLLNFFRINIEEHVVRISQIIIIKEKSIMQIIKTINVPKYHPILDIVNTFSNEVKSNHIIMAPMILPENFLYLNYQDVILKFGDLIGLKTRKSESIFIKPIKILKILAHALRMGVFMKLLKQIKSFLRP